MKQVVKRTLFTCTAIALLLLSLQSSPPSKAAACSPAIPCDQCEPVMWEIWNTAVNSTGDLYAGDAAAIAYCTGKKLPELRRV